MKLFLYSEKGYGRRRKGERKEGKRKRQGDSSKRARETETAQDFTYSQTVEKGEGRQRKRRHTGREGKQRRNSSMERGKEGPPESKVLFYHMAFLKCKGKPQTAKDLLQLDSLDFSVDIIR